MTVHVKIVIVQNVNVSLVRRVSAPVQHVNV